MEFSDEYGSRVKGFTTLEYRKKISPELTKNFPKIKFLSHYIKLTHKVLWSSI